MQTTEVTQGQWKSVMGSNPSRFINCGDDCPVENISLEDAQKFIERLNLNENTNQYRLPTEAQWEYAARAGSTTALANGHLSVTSCHLLDTNLNAMGWYCGNSGWKTHQVAQKQINAWGLYDMHGNVEELCSDWYDGSTYPDKPVTDPMGPSEGIWRVSRGGNYWSQSAQYCRSAERSYFGNSNSTNGLRLSRTLKP